MSSDLPSLHAPLRVAGRGWGGGVLQQTRRKNESENLPRHPPPPTPKSELRSSRPHRSEGGGEKKRAHLRTAFRGKGTSPRGSNRHFQHAEFSESAQVSGIDDQAVDQAADRRHRARIDRPHDRDIRAVDGDGRAGKPSAG